MTDQELPKMTRPVYEEGRDLDLSQPLYTITFHRTDDGRIVAEESRNGIIPSERIAVLTSFVYDAIRTAIENSIQGLGLSAEESEVLRDSVRDVYNALRPIGAGAQEATADYFREHPR